MTRTIFGRRQAVIRQRARQEAWRLALRDEVEQARARNAELVVSELLADTAESLATAPALAGAPQWKNRP